MEKYDTDEGTRMSKRKEGMTHEEFYVFKEQLKDRISDARFLVADLNDMTGELEEILSSLYRDTENDDDLDDVFPKIKRALKDAHEVHSPLNEAYYWLDVAYSTMS